MASYATPAAVVQTPMQATTDQRERYKSTLFKLGMTETFFGLVFFITNIISIAVVSSDTYHYRLESIYIIYISPGIWCGLFSIVSGVLGICSRQNPSYGMYIANMVMTIFTSLAMLSLIGLSAVLAILSESVLVLILQLICTVGGFVIFIVAVIHSAYCCAGVCCGARPHQMGGIVYAHAQGGQQVIQLPNGQYAQVQTYPLTMSQGFSSSVVNIPQPVPPQFQGGFVAPGTSMHYAQNQPIIPGPGLSKENVPPPYDAPNAAFSPI